MNRYLEPLRFYSMEEMGALHRNAVRILAEVGIKIDHHEALDYLQAAGCHVDRNTMIVKITEEVSEKWIAKMKRDFETRREPECMAVRYSHIRFRSEPFQIHRNFTVSTGGYCAYIYDLEGRRRPATLRDTREALILADRLEQITFTGLPVAAQDVPLPIRQIRMAAELVKHTSKLGGIEALSIFDIEYIQRIGEVVRGSREELKRRPILVGYAEAKSPLTLDYNMAEVLMEYVKRGMPQSLDTMPNGGLTAPIRPAGALALGLAETIAGLVLAYSIDPDAVISLDITPSFADPSTGIYRYAGAERAVLLCARIQLISEYYGCPSGVHGGKTDSLGIDIRCGVEKGASMLMPVLAGAVGFGTVGHIENAVTFAPAQLVIDDAIAQYVRRMVTDFEISDEAINFELIEKIGIGGNYLQEEDTVQNFRGVLNLSPFFRTDPWHDDGSDDVKKWERAAAGRVKDILDEEHEKPLSESQENEIDSIVAEAEAKLREQGVSW
jgi:trimethylamine--corrinoid protein Co-methyltransferase